MQLHARIKSLKLFIIMRTSQRTSVTLTPRAVHVLITPQTSVRFSGGASYGAKGLKPPVFAQAPHIFV